MAEPRPQTQGPERPMILLADDEHAIREALGQFLHRAGFDLLEASTGDRALELAQTRVVDLCVLDVLMPGLDGREVLRRLRRAGSFTPRRGSDWQTSPRCRSPTTPLRARTVSRSKCCGCRSYSPTCESWPSWANGPPSASRCPWRSCWKKSRPTCATCRPVAA